MINQILKTDALDLLSRVEDSAADLIILDPPYQFWDKFCDDGLIQEATRVLKTTGNILCFTKQPFDFNLRNAVDPIFRREIIWTFTNGGAWVSKRMPLVSSQKIYHLAINNRECFFNERTGVDYSDATKDFKRSKKVFEGYEEDGRKFQKHADGIWLRDHLHFNKPNTGKIPSKPQKLYDILINCYCPAGGLVIEPFAGSGNFAKSCIKQDKLFLGSEIDDEIFQYAQANILTQSNHEKQQTK